ncbi:MAG: NifB/NifX family molybdenum-iron cluster-binding protein [Acidobacteriota bacterium]|jgi:predicted Fe-Mo cluster-binding NifX family protein
MKIAFTSSGKSLSAPLEGRFGRAPKIIVFDTETESTEVLDNRAGTEAAQGAGTQTAEKLARLGAERVVTGHCGPKAFRVLQAAGIQVFTSESTTVAEALHALQSGRLTALQAADVEGPWGQ